MTHTTVHRMGPAQGRIWTEMSAVWRLRDPEGPEPFSNSFLFVEKKDQ